MDPALDGLSDEFEGGLRWQSLNTAAFRLVDVGQLHPGQLSLLPVVGGWHDARRASLLFVSVEGDFAVDSMVTAGAGTPRRPPMSSSTWPACWPEMT
ncbi:MAG: hypothetical protein R3F43_05275 [bacterium]